jgi:hypothetical protein
MQQAKRPERKRWHTPQYDQQDVRAIQALAAGSADAWEQERALKWIIEQACSCYDEPFRPGEQDATNYMLGRRSVGLAIIKMMKLSHEVFEVEAQRRRAKHDY